MAFTYERFFLVVFVVLFVLLLLLSVVLYSSFVFLLDGSRADIRSTFLCCPINSHHGGFIFSHFLYIAPYASSMGLTLCVCVCVFAIDWSSLRLWMHVRRCRPLELHYTCVLSIFGCMNVFFFLFRESNTNFFLPSIPIFLHCFLATLFLPPQPPPHTVCVYIWPSHIIVAPRSCFRLIRYTPSQMISYIHLFSVLDCI